MAVKRPISHSAKVAAMSFFRQLIQMIEDVFCVVPVLHQESIGMVDDHDLDRAQEAMIPLFDTNPSQLRCRTGGESQTYSSGAIAVYSPNGLAIMISEL